MESTQNIFMTKLRYPFGISRGVDTELPTVIFRLGELGQGEAAPVRYKNQKAPEVIPVLQALAKDVNEGNLDDFEGHDERARRLFPQHSAALAAFNMALWDAKGRRENKPVYSLVRTTKPALTTTYTVSLSDFETMEQRAREAAHLPALKMKLGRSEEFDLEVMKRIRKAAPNPVLRIDANAGWTLKTAIALIPLLADMGVDIIEQPLAIGNLEDLKTLHEQSPLPIIADEDAQDLHSLKALVGRCSGINIKLMKCGGITEALKMIKFAEQENWKILIGCMIETRLGLGAAAHLCGRVNYADLDAHMLTTNDPFPGGSVEVPTQEIPLADGPGLGLPFVDIN